MVPKVTTVPTSGYEPRNVTWTELLVAMSSSASYCTRNKFDDAGRESLQPDVDGTTHGTFCQFPGISSTTRAQRS